MKIIKNEEYNNLVYRNKTQEKCIESLSKEVDKLKKENEKLKEKIEIDKFANCYDYVILVKGNNTKTYVHGIKQKGVKRIELDCEVANIPTLIIER